MGDLLFIGSSLHTCTQEDLDLHRQQDHNVAPVRQIKDSEEAAAYKEQVKANKLARRRKQKVQASTTQDLARKEVVIKSGNTAPVFQNGNTVTADKYEGVVVREVAPC